MCTRYINPQVKKYLPSICEIVGTSKGHIIPFESPLLPSFCPVTALGYPPSLFTFRSTGFTRDRIRILRRSLDNGNFPSTETNILAGPF